MVDRAVPVIDIAPLSHGALPRHAPAAAGMHCLERTRTGRETKDTPDMALAAV